MPLAFYMDQHVPRAITNGLRLRGVDVLTAYEDGASAWDDSAYPCKPLRGLWRGLDITE